MSLFFNSFPSRSHAHLQQAFYSVLESANQVGKVHGDSKTAWDDWLEKIQCSSFDIGKEVAGGSYSKEIKLPEVSPGSGNKVDGMDQMILEEDEEQLYFDSFVLSEAQVVKFVCSLVF